MLISKLHTKFTVAWIYRWTIYLCLLLIGLVFNFQQFFVEKFMQIYLGNTKFVVSLSTTPYRINEIGDTLESIFQQDLRPDKIYLAVPYLFKRDNIEYIIPDWLAKDERITIIRTQDYGPATKLLGVLEQAELDPQTIIITIDDDIIYPKNGLLHLVYAAATNPNHAVGYAGVNLQYNEQGLVSDQVTNGIIPIYTSDQPVTVLEGFGSVAYRRKFFDHQIFDIVNAPRECINSDDLYLSFHLAKKNIPRMVLRNKFINKFQLDIESAIGHDQNALHNLIPSPAQKHRACVNFMRQQDPLVVF